MTRIIQQMSIIVPLTFLKHGASFPPQSRVHPRCAPPSAGKYRYVTYTATWIELGHSKEYGQFVRRIQSRLSDIYTEYIRPFPFSYDHVGFKYSSSRDCPLHCPLDPSSPRSKHFHPPRTDSKVLLSTPMVDLKPSSLSRQGIRGIEKDRRC